MIHFKVEPTKFDHKNSDEFLAAVAEAVLKSDIKNPQAQLVRALRLGRRLNHDKWPTPLADLGLSVRAHNALVRFGVENIGQLFALEQFLNLIVGLGQPAQQEVAKVISMFAKENGFR